MMINYILSALLLLSTAQAQEPPKAAILGPGVYVLEELQEDPEGEWLGLIQTPEGIWRLEPVTAQISPTLLEGDPSDAPTGLRVAASGSGHALLMIRGLPLKAARAPVANVSYSPSNLPGEQTIVCSFGAETFRIWGEPVRGTDKVVVKMSKKDKLQEIYMLADNRSSSWDILWAGDLDGDGQLDLLFAVVDKNMGKKMLLLSGRAKSIDMVAEAGKHAYSFGD